MARNKKIIVIGKQRTELDPDLMVQIIIAYAKQLMQEAANQASEAPSPSAPDDGQKEAS